MALFKRLTRVRPGNLGSLGFLPLEVCNKIYAFLLTDFDPPSTELEITESGIQSLMTDSAWASHSIDTTILRVSRDVHLEAYDLMVKKNRFVRVISRGVPNYLLSAMKVPIVTTNSDHVNRFRGYVLEVTMTSHEEPVPEMPPRAHDPFEAMILARDAGALCFGLMSGNKVIPGFADRVNLVLNLGLVVTASREARDYEDLESLKRYFSEKNQKEILQPFSDFLFDVHNFQVRGLVSADVANSTCNGAASSKWGDPQEVLDHFTAWKEISLQYLERGETSIASDSYVSAVSDIDTLRMNNHWPRLVQEGGEHFITQLAELYFRLNLSCAHLFMSLEGDGVFVRLARSSLVCANRAMTTGHWKGGFTWQPPRELRALLHIRTARFFRLRGDLMDAMGELDDALQLCPDDPAILMERRLLSASVFEAVMTAH